MESGIEIGKIKKSVKIIRNLIRVATFIGYIGIVACLFVIAKAILKSDFFFNTPYLHEVLIQNSIDTNIFTRKWAVFLMGTYIMNIVFVILIFKYLGRILHTVEKGNPFNNKNYREISIIGWIIIIGVNLIPVIDYFISRIILKIPSQLKGIGNNGVLTMYFLRIDWKVTVLGIFAGVLILILAQVFKYGTYLQNEYDSTL